MIFIVHVCQSIRNGNILKDSLEVIAKEQFWVNPDCGLKTRHEEETIASLKNMVPQPHKRTYVNESMQSIEIS